MYGFSLLASPLTDLTKKGALKRSREAEGTFDKLKETCLVLALLVQQHLGRVPSQVLACSGLSQATSEIIRLVSSRSLEVFNVTCWSKVGRYCAMLSLLSNMTSVYLEG